MATMSNAPIVARTVAYLRDSGPATVNSIAQDLNLSRTSVENSIAALTELELALEGPSATGKGAGRPARLYRFNADMGIVVGVDIGIASIRVLVADISGVVLTQHTFPGIEGRENATAKLSAVLDTIRQTIQEVGRTVAQIRAIGVALPAIMDDAGLVTTSVIIPEWSGVDLGAQLRHAFPCPVALDNGVRLAAVAEHHMGVAQLVDDVLYLSVGYRIAMGLILGGVPRRGAHNVAGDIGRLAFQALTDETGYIQWQSAPTAEQVFDLANNGDTEAEAELDRFIDGLALGLATIVMTVDPSIVVIGGGLSGADERFFDPLRRALRRQTRLPFELPLIKARLGADAAAYGALVHAFHRHGDLIYGIEGMSVPNIKVLSNAG